MVHLASLLALLASPAAGQGYPNSSYTPDQAWQIVSPDLGDRHFNQPHAVQGYLLLGGNAIHELWDVSDPFAPSWVATLESPFHDGEAESHQLSVRKLADGTVLVATISGLGVDLWDLTDPFDPELLSALELDGIHYGDNTAAVWGVAWQGAALYVGGTNTGIHVVDTTDPRDPQVVTRLPTTAFGGVSAGPLYAVGNLLVVTAPKDHRGLATLDIGDPWDPAWLDSDVPPDDTYIGAFYEGRAYAVDPFTTWDVTTDPSDIRLVARHETFASEYVSFGDGYAFLGAMRPNPGVHKIDLADPTVFADVGSVAGRTDFLAGAFNDDQFSLPIGNLVVLCDDEIRYGCVLGVHDTQPDFDPPVVAVVHPPDGAANQPVTTRIGLSMSDQLDIRSVDTDAVVVRALSGGPPVSGSWGLTHTVLSFWPDAPLAPDTTYEVVVPAGGLTDLAGNPTPTEFRSVFATGPDVASLRCAIGSPGPVEVGADATLEAVDSGGTDHSWDFGDGALGDGAVVTHRWTEPGRHVVRLTVSDGPNARSCTAVQVVHRPLTARAPTHASTVAVDPVGRRAWVVNADHDSVSAVSLDTLELLFEVSVGDHPRTVARTDDGRIWVANQGSDSVTVLDADGGVLDEVRLDWGDAPYGVAADGDGVWVTLEQPGELARIEGGRVVARIPLGTRARPPQVRGLAVAPNGDVWVSRFVSGPDRGELYRVANGRVAVVPLRVDPGPDSNDEGRGVPNYLVNLTVSPDGARLLAPSKKDNVGRGLSRDGQPLDADNTVRTVVSFVDLDGGAEATAERVDLDDRERLVAGVYSPAGDLLFVASQGSNQVDVLDAYTGQRVAGFGTGLAPDGLALHDGLILVNDALDRTLTVVDVSGVLAGTDGAAWPVAAIPTVSSEVLSPEVLLGKQIFTNASSREMSADGYLSCATCHLDGGHDGQTWDFTDRGEGLRNTIDLRGKAGLGQGPLHWTANFDEVQDFENDVRHAFGGSGFLDDADFEATADTLGAPKAGRSARLDALAAYVTSLDRFPRSPHRAPNGDLTEDAERGRKIVERRCLDCHGGPALTDSAKGDLHDVGTLRPGSGQRLGGRLTGLDTPTLLGLWATAPYLHDGSADTLEAVLAQEDHLGRLSDREVEAVAAFLRQVEPRDLPLEPRGCGCATGAGGAATWLGLLFGMVAVRRRVSRAA